METPRELQIGLCDFEIQGPNTEFIGLTGNVVEGEITGTVALGDVPLSEKDKKVIENLPLADNSFDKSRHFHLDILIGNDFCPMLLNSAKLRLEKSSVYLLDTKLGWVSSGVIKGKPLPVSSECESLALITFDRKKPVVLEENTSFLPENLWDFEAIGIKDQVGKNSDFEDSFALKKFRDSVKFEDGRVSVQWLKKDTIVDLPTNFPVALSRLKTCLKNLSKNEEYFNKYHKNFND